MADPTGANGLSTESTLTFEEMEVDPFYNTDNPAVNPSPVWKHSDTIQKLLKERNPDNDGLTTLSEELKRQIPTIALYWQILENRKPGKKSCFYVVLFPGEARDNTGIKDLNDKVLGYKQCTEYILLRKKEIENLFGKPGEPFFLIGQNFKVAYICTDELKREAFIKGLRELDAKLRAILLDVILPAAEKEANELKEEEKKKRLKAIADLRKALKPKDYRFDIYFGMVIREFHQTVIDTVFLLLTEALKGAGMARYAAKGKSLRYDVAKKIVTERPDPEKTDSRGKEFGQAKFIFASEGAVKIKKLIISPKAGGRAVFPGDLFNIL